MSALSCFLFLVAIAVSKTILTKHIFEQIGAPVAMSALSCIVTGLMLVPICLVNGTLRLLTMEETKTLSLVCLTVAADLVFTNVGLSILPIAFQQAIKSTLPVATIAIEFLLYRKCVSKALFAIVIGICLGPITMALDKDFTSDGDLLYGVMMLSLSIVAGAFKYVLAHSAMARFKEDMGVIGFTFWMEVFATIFILPWSIANGEGALLMEHGSSWVLLIGTAAFGGVRILAQFFFLEKTSPTTLATSNIVIQVGLTAAGALVFHDPITVSLVFGTLITVVMSASYTYIKGLKSLHTRLEGPNEENAVEDEAEELQSQKGKSVNEDIIGDE
jgi:drug/metabolite transporter (DMT)-like permease